jgi:hypothetical protein
MELHPAIPHALSVNPTTTNSHVDIKPTSHLFRSQQAQLPLRPAALQRRDEMKNGQTLEFARFGRVYSHRLEGTFIEWSGHPVKTNLAPLHEKRL